MAPNVLTYAYGLHLSLPAMPLLDCFLGVWRTIALREVTYGVSLLHPHLPLCGAAASVDCLARGCPAVWHGIAGPGVTYGVSLLLPFVHHTLLFPGLIHSGRVRRLIGVALGDPHVRQTFLHTHLLIGKLEQKY